MVKAEELARAPQGVGEVVASRATIARKQTVLQLVGFANLEMKYCSCSQSVVGYLFESMYLRGHVFFGLQRASAVSPLLRDPADVPVLYLRVLPLLILFRFHLRGEQVLNHTENFKNVLQGKRFVQDVSDQLVLDDSAHSQHKWPRNSLAKSSPKNMEVP